MADMDRRQFLSKTALAAGGMFASSLLAEDLLAENLLTKSVEVATSDDETLWIGGY